MRITIAHARDATRTKLVSATITTVSYHNLDITAARVSDIGQKVAHSATFQKVLVDARIEATQVHTTLVVVVAAEQVVEITPRVPS
jgi:hypothetical protein